jgi:RNA 2',3'-cyclic 3'-phosphodiesterase
MAIVTAHKGKNAFRVVVRGRSGHSAMPQEAANAVEHAAATLGFPPDGKPFTPHLTLARVKGRSRALGNVLYNRLQPGPRQTGVLGTLPVSAIGLIKSELRPAGSVYTPLFHVPLAGSRK